MHRIAEQIPQVAEARLLSIEGEAGTGKQFLARYIARLNPAGAHFVAEDATDLFPTEEATQEPGVSRIILAAEQASKGILLIRNVDELTAGRQVQLLHFVRQLETAFVLGAPSLSGSPGQVICTARRSLRSLALTESFLPELYYRLNTVSFSLPPLRERKEDIPALAQSFIEAFSREHHRPIQGLGPGSLAILLRHRWPGNVRELESVILAACFSAEGQWLRPIDLVILPLEAVRTTAAAPAPPQDLTLDGVIRRHVQHVLKLCDGNKARAASQLGISRSTLYRMIESDASSTIHEAEFSPETEGASNTELVSDDPVGNEGSAECTPSN